MVDKSDPEVYPKRTEIITSMRDVRMIDKSDPQVPPVMVYKF